MKIEDLEQVHDLPQSTPADFYLAMLDGYIAIYLASHCEELCYFEDSGELVGKLHIRQKSIDNCDWTIWKKKAPKPWEELLKDRVIACWVSNVTDSPGHSGLSQFRHIEKHFVERFVAYEDVEGSHWKYATPVADAEFDEMKAGF
jgi:hypothetical protein